MFIQRFLAVVALTFTYFSQSLYCQIVLQGAVRDGVSEPVKNALVELIDQVDSTRTFSSYTDEQGQYAIQIDVTGVDDNQLSSPGSFKLLQNYPNPFNPSTVITYELSQPTYIVIEIHNILGQKIKTLFNGFQNNRTGQVVWDATDDLGRGVSAGVYIYSLKAEGTRISRKMLLIDGNYGSTNVSISQHLSTNVSDKIVLNKIVSNTYLLRVTGEGIETFEQSNLDIATDKVLNITIIRIGTVSDVDGNTYKTVKIGYQWWMAENLKVTHYRNGHSIPNVTKNSEWFNLSIGAYCAYNNNEFHASTYGYLYNWYTVNDSCNIAPEGWHVPSEEDWLQLEMYLGMSRSAANTWHEWRGTDEGGKLKEAGTEHWASPNTGATNESRFSALPGGFRRSEDGTYDYLSQGAWFWNSRECGSTAGTYRILFYTEPTVFRYCLYKNYGISVRCVRDSEYQLTPFDFIDKFDVSRGEEVTSNTVTISGLQGEINISISGGAYSINNNDFTTESGVINNQDEVRIMLTASGNYGKVTTSKLMVGDFTATFSVRTEDAPDAGWAMVPEIMSNINPPVFPDNDFLITNYGAIGDGTTDCTNAFKDAISDCNQAGGGRVVVPEGTFLSGAIHLKSNVNLYVSQNALIKFSQNYSDYLPVVYTRFEGTECYNYSPPIYAFEQENIAITGQGTLDGQGDNSHWWPWKSTGSSDVSNLRQQAEDGVPVENRIYGAGHYLRPNMIQPYRCKNILIDSVTIINSPMWHIHPVLCENVTVSNVTVEGLGPNNDGCNPESSKNVLIDNCYFNTGDDCIAIDSGRDADGRRVNVPSENIIIKNCTMEDGHGGVAVGSLTSGSARNIFVSDCYMDSPRLNMAFRIKTNSIRGGTVENIYLKDITVGMVSDAAIRVNYFYGEGDIGEFTPIVRNIEIQNMTCQMTYHALIMEGYERSKISDIRLINCNFTYVGSNNILSNIQNIGLNNVSINGENYNKILEPFEDQSVSVNQQSDLNTPATAVLMQNYPNPFNPATTIQFALPEETTVLLEIYNSAGQLIETLVNESMGVGNYNVIWDAANMPSGIYFYRIKAGSFQDLKKMILMK